MWATGRAQPGPAARRPVPEGGLGTCPAGLPAHKLMLIENNQSFVGFGSVGADDRQPRKEGQPSGTHENRASSSFQGGAIQAPEHWQSLWARGLPHAERVEQDDWLTPKREDWVPAPWKRCCCRSQSLSSWWRTAWAASPPRMRRHRLQRVFKVRCWWRLLIPERRAHLADFAPVP